MARDFVAASSESITIADHTEIDITADITCFYWLRRTGAGKNDGIFNHWIGSAGYIFYYPNPAPERVAWQCDGSSNRIIQAVASTQDVWVNVIGTRENAGSGIELFIDNVSEGTNTSTLTTNSDEVYLARYSSANTFSNVILSYLAIWDVELSANERQALSNGITPFVIRHSSLKFFMPLWGTDDPEPDYISTTDGTVDNTPLKTLNPPVELLENYL